MRCTCLYARFWDNGMDCYDRIFGSGFFGGCVVVVVVAVGGVSHVRSSYMLYTKRHVLDPELFCYGNDR